MDLPSSGTHVSRAEDSARNLLASRPLARALLLFLRKMQQESFLLFQSSEGSLEAGLRFPGQHQARPGKHLLSSPSWRCPSEQPWFWMLRRDIRTMLVERETRLLL